MSAIFSWSERMVSHIGNEKGPNFLKISSEEYWTMNASLIQQNSVSDDG